MTNSHDVRTCRPEEHHQPWQTLRLFLPPIVPNLRDQLNAPQYSAYGS